MYVRLHCDSDGIVKLQQLLTLQDPSSSETKPTWEDVPITGIGSSQKSSFPIKSSGVFLITENHTTHLIPALSISKIVDVDEFTTKIEARGNFFYVKTPHLELIKIITKLINKFDIVKIENGYLTKEDA